MIKFSLFPDDFLLASCLPSISLEPKLKIEDKIYERMIFHLFFNKRKTVLQNTEPDILKKENMVLQNTNSATGLQKS